MQNSISFAIQKLLLAALSLVFSFVIADVSQASQLPEFVDRVVPDGIEWDFKTEGTIYAIGDVHGAFKELVVILHDRGLIDGNLDWTGRDSQLVLLGDLFDGGEHNKDSRLIMDLLLRLERQAVSKGGRVHVALGNHDLQVLAGRLDKMEKPERKKFKKYAIDGMFYNKTRDAIQRSPFGGFLARQNQIIGINDFLFVHAGVNPRVLREHGLNVAQVNTIVRNHINAWRLLSHGFAVGVDLPEFLNFEGPSWYGGFKLRDMEDGRKRDSSAPTKDEFGSWMAEYQKKHMMGGHRGTPDSEIVLSDPYYGDLYISGDTGIGFRKDGGRLSVLEIRPDGEMQAHYPAYDKNLANSLKERALGMLISRGGALACAALFH